MMIYERRIFNPFGSVAMDCEGKMFDRAEELACNHLAWTAKLSPVAKKPNHKYHMTLTVYNENRHGGKHLASQDTISRYIQKSYLS